MTKILFIIEALTAAAFLAAFPIFNAGNIFALPVCAAAAVLTGDLFGCRTAVGRLWGKVPGKIIMIAVITLAAAGCIYAAVLSAKMAVQMKNAPEREPELVVVLGCQVKGERPSRMLRHRLEAALGLLERCPDTVCVVSGGKGSDELISEAECMFRWLTEHGIDSERIIMEDKSTSTYENIHNTFAITDKLGYGRDITIVTNGFHQYRASLIAKQAGAGEVTAVSARTEARFVPTYWVREWLGITYLLIKVNSE